MADKSEKEDREEAMRKLVDQGIKVPEKRTEKLTYNKVDLSGKTAIVTGSNSGIGYYTARDFVLMGARVIMACRSPTKAKAAMDDLKKEVGSENSKLVEFMALDLSSLQSVMDFVEEFKKKGYPLHLLICNAGAWFKEKAITADGLESFFQVNYLSHFLLTLHLLPVMRNSGKDCRIINVVSAAHAGGVFDLENLRAEKSFDAMHFYDNSKLFQLMNMYSLQRRLADTDIKVFSLCPGFIHTNIVKDATATSQEMTDLIQGMLDQGLANHPADGAVTTLHVATSRHDKGGLYFTECKALEPDTKAKNETDQEKLWKYSLEQLKKFTNPDILKGLE